MATPLAVTVPTLLLPRPTKSCNTVCKLLFLTFVSTKSQTQHTFVAITMEIGWFRIRHKLFVSFAIFIVFWAYYAPPSLPFLYLYWQMRQFYSWEPNGSRSRPSLGGGRPRCPLLSCLPSLFGDQKVRGTQLRCWDEPEGLNGWKAWALPSAKFVVRPTRDGGINLISARGNMRWASRLQCRGWTTKGCQEGVELCWWHTQDGWCWGERGEMRNGDPGGQKQWGEGEPGFWAPWTMCRKPSKAVLPAQVRVAALPGSDSWARRANKHPLARTGYSCTPKSTNLLLLDSQGCKLSNKFLDAQKKTQGLIVLNVGFPQPKSMVSLCQKCSRLGSDSTSDAYAKRKLFPQLCDRYIISLKTVSRLH